MKKILAILTAVLMLAAFAGCGSGASKTDSDSDYVKEKGKLVIGITDFKPMDVEETKGSGEWIGFDADMAKAFAKSLGVDAEFIVIDWDNKIMELNAKSIDCVWNGMTLNDKVKSAMAVSDPYCKNAQVVVVPSDKAETYHTKEAIKDLKFAAEAGSAGEDALKALKYNVTAVTAQSDALMEVAAGTSDACVIDLIMAGAMIGEGTSYPNLTYTVQLEPEEYVVGFRKGSDLAEKLNSFFEASLKDGSMMQTATTYGVQESIIEK